MRYFFTAITLLLLISNGYSQDSDFTDAELMEISTNINNLTGSYYLSAQSRSVKGDPYFNDEWLKGKVQINEKAHTGNMLLRFNTADNILEFTRGGELFLMDSNKIAGFVLFGNPDSLTFKNGFNSDKHKIGTDAFLRIIYDGKIKLVAHHTSSLKKDIPSYGSAIRKDEYVDDTDFFIIDPEGSFLETKLKRKDILKDLGIADNTQITNFAKQKKLDFGKESDIKQILAYYEKLNK